MQNFENYLCERNDTIDNAAYPVSYTHLTLPTIA